MKILFHGKDDGFTLLKTMLYIIPLLLVVSAMLFIYAQEMRHSASALDDAESVIEKENLWVKEYIQK